MSSLRNGNKALLAAILGVLATILIASVPVIYGYGQLNATVEGLREDVRELRGDVATTRVTIQAIAEEVRRSSRQP